MPARRTATSCAPTITLRKWGQDRRATAMGIVYAVELGFVAITQKGRHGAAEFRAPSRYRLTYVPTRGAVPTDEWNGISTQDQLNARLQTIARILAERHELAAKRWRLISQRKRSAQVQRHFSGRKNAPGTGRKNAPAEHEVRVQKCTYCRGCKNVPTFYISGWGARGPHQAQRRWGARSPALLPRAKRALFKKKPRRAGVASASERRGRSPLHLNA
jgi:hypothetical protein